MDDKMTRRKMTFSTSHVVSTLRSKWPGIFEGSNSHLPCCHGNVAPPDAHSSKKYEFVRKIYTCPTNA